METITTEKRINETFQMCVKGTTVTVSHDGFNKADSNQTAFIKQQIQMDMNRGQQSGFHPYNNFECSWEWKIF